MSDLDFSANAEEGAHDGINGNVSTSNTSNTNPSTTQPPISFLSLPLELKQMIFRYLLPGIVQIQIQPHTQSQRLHHSQSQSQRPLIGTKIFKHLTPNVSKEYREAVLGCGIEILKGILIEPVRFISETDILNFDDPDTLLTFMQKSQSQSQSESQPHPLETLNLKTLALHLPCLSNSYQIPCLGSTSHGKIIPHVKGLGGVVRALVAFKSVRKLYFVMSAGCRLGLDFDRGDLLERVRGYIESGLRIELGRGINAWRSPEIRWVGRGREGLMREVEL